MMMTIRTIHTTVHLQQRHSLALYEKAKKLGITRSMLMVILMRRILVNWKRLKRHNISVQYQKNVNKEKWKVVHVFLDPKDYEVCTDMRKFFKWSVSALLAMAIDLYIDEISSLVKSKIKQHSDNYNILNHKCDAKLYNSSICWHIVWELDDKFAQKLTQ